MRFLIFDTDYLSFLNWLYAQHPSLGDKSYDEQMQVRLESLFACEMFFHENALAWYAMSAAAMLAIRIIHLLLRTSERVLQCHLKLAHWDSRSC